MDLADIRPGERVLLIGADDAALQAVLARGGVTSTQPQGRYDVVCVVGQRLSPSGVRTFTESLRPTGRLVVVLDNAASPLRAADRLTRRGPTTRAVSSMAQVSRVLDAAGFDVVQVFGLLRSSAAPTTAFDLTAPGAVRAVLGATLSHVGGWRGALIRRLVAGPPARLGLLCPAWLVIARPQAASGTSSDTGSDSGPGTASGTGSSTALSDLVVGKISNRDSDEVKLLRGNPPRLLEKRYLRAGADIEADALRELERVGFDLAPRLVGEPSADECVMTWLPGAPLVAARLNDDELLTWVRAAGTVLTDLHARTRAADGSVLAHGDFWLGNLLVADGRVAGVIDWTGAHFGHDTTDRAFLVETTARLRPNSPAFRELLEAASAGT